MEDKNTENDNGTGSMVSGNSDGLDNNQQNPIVGSNPVSQDATNSQAVTQQPIVSQSPQVAPAQADSLNPLQQTAQINTAPATVPVPTPTKSGKKSRRLLLPIIAGVMLLFGGAAAAYNTFVLNSSDGIWNTALQRTSGGLESILAATTKQPAKGGTLEGSFKLDAPTAADGSIAGSWYESTVQLTGDIGVLGLRPKAEVRAIPASAGQSPDIYIKISDIAGVGALLGGGNPALTSIVDEIDDSWFVIDRTLYEQALLSESQNGIPEISTEELTQINDAILAVVNERLFTDDESKAVVIAEEYIGEEEFKGAKTYKYKLKVQKQQLVDFAVALKDALKDTPLSEVLLNGSDSDSFEQALDFDSLLEELEAIDVNGFSADAWVDKELRYIRNIRITPTDGLPENETGYLDFYLPYEGGDVFPFTINVNSENTDTEAKNSLTAQMSINRESLATDLSIDINVDESEEKIIGSAKLSVVPSEDQIEVVVPDNARNIFELIGLFIGGPNMPIEPLEPFPSDTLGDFDFRDLFGNPTNLYEQEEPVL